MKLERTILTGLYLLMMVLLPFLHLTSHAHDDEAVIQSSCVAHDHGHEDQPDGNSEPGDNPHDSCSLCQLLALSVDSPKTTIQLHVSFSLLPTFEISEQVLFSTRPQTHQARAPPFMTV